MGTQISRIRGNQHDLWPPYEVVMSELRAKDPRYDVWVDFYLLLHEACLNPPTQPPVWLGEMGDIHTAVSRMIELAGQNPTHWLFLWRAVVQELVERGLINEEGRVCP